MLALRGSLKVEEKRLICSQSLIVHIMVRLSVHDKVEGP